MQVKVTWGKSLDKVVKEGWNLNDEEETVMEKLEDIYFIT